MEKPLCRFDDWGQILCASKGCWDIGSKCIRLRGACDCGREQMRPLIDWSDSCEHMEALWKLVFLSKINHDLQIKKEGKQKEQKLE